MKQIKHILCVIRWAWCAGCWQRTDQQKTEGGWLCACGKVNSYG